MSMFSCLIETSDNIRWMDKTCKRDARGVIYCILSRCTRLHFWISCFLHFFYTFLYTFHHTLVHFWYTWYYTSGTLFTTLWVHFGTLFGTLLHEMPTKSYHEFHDPCGSPITTTWESHKGLLGIPLLYMGVIPQRTPGNLTTLVEVPQSATGNPTTLAGVPLLAWVS
jgi:hypothetical protein